MAITPNTPNPVREDAYKTELATKLGIDAQYIPSSPVWRNEEEIAAIAEMFSNMTAGSSGGVLVVHGSDDDAPVLDKTWQEISDAWSGGSVVILVSSYGDLEYLSAVPTNPAEGVYAVNFFGNQNTSEMYVASSASGYPVFSS